MAFNDEEAAAIEAEEKHASRGACVAMILFPPIVCCAIWAVLSFTTEGQDIVARAYLYATYNGATVNNVTAGFRGIARASCALDQVDPRPGYYDTLQGYYEVFYRNMVQIYREAWEDLAAQGEDVSGYDDPARIPPELTRGKGFYCR